MREKISNEEYERYSRQILLPEIGAKGQQKLKNTKVLVVGAGGLGVPVLHYLSAAGIGKIGIADGDQVDLSNLHRQVLYSSNDVGKNKANVAGLKLRELNPHIDVVSYPELLTPENAKRILGEYHIIIDGTDNFPARYLVNDACVKLEKPFISGAILRFTGQVGVFNCDGSGTYRCLFPEPPSDQPDCNNVGVTGVVPGCVGMLMANEAIKMICGIGELLAGKILTVDFLSMKFQAFSFRRDDEAVEEIKSSPLMDTRDYEQFCSGRSQHNDVKEVSFSELQAMTERKDNFQLIDVREAFEREEFNVGGIHLPFEEVLNRADEISKDKPVVFYCKAGIRSHIVIQRLQEKLGLNNLYNLKGGLRGSLHFVKSEDKRIITHHLSSD